VGNKDQDHRMGQHWVAFYIDANSKVKYYDPTGRSSFLRAYMNYLFRSRCQVCPELFSLYLCNHILGLFYQVACLFPLYLYNPIPGLFS
jgi:hypothetical protein